MILQRTSPPRARATPAITRLIEKLGLTVVTVKTIELVNCVLEIGLALKH